MNNTLEIVYKDGMYRVDSRLLAHQLGYDHKVLLQSIRRHKARLEARSALLHFEALLTHQGYQGSTRQKYYLLDERQCLILAGSLKKGAEADEWHDRLVDAFLQVRARVQELERQAGDPSPRGLNSLWERRALLFHEKTCIPEGYWCVFSEIANVCWGMEVRGEYLQEDAVPDISVGRCWMKEVRRLGFDESLILKYPHHYPDRRGLQSANIYPNAWLGAFRDWFARQYLKQEFRLYVHKHVLPSPSGQKLLSQRNQSTE